MKRIASFLLVFLAIGTMTVYATTAKRGETWLIEYTIQWEDTYETITQGVLTFTCQKESQNLEVYCRRQINWSGGSDNKLVKRVDGKNRAQILIINCVKQSD